MARTTSAPPTRMAATVASEPAIRLPLTAVTEATPMPVLEYMMILPL
jgi:hypothetical protein